MRSKRHVRIATLAVAGAAALCAQEAPLPRESVTLNLPKDSPVAVLSLASDQSRTIARGAALVLDLHMGLTLRNSTPNRIRGVTLRVVAQEVAMGGKGSVTIPSMNVGPGEVFPVRIDMQLVRPTQAAAGPLVQVDLDGVLFQDLSFFGPDRLSSRRYMTACELEAQRDREFFKSVLARGGANGLQQQMLESLKRQAEVAPLTVKVRRGAAVTSAAVAPEHPAEFAFLRFPDSPVEPVQGWAQISGNEARAPQIEVRNKSGKPVKYVELGWVVSDQAGRQYMAARLPSADGTLLLPPGQTAKVLQESTLNFTSNGQPVSVRKMTGFVNQVEFADGKVWVPNRQNLGDPVLLKTLAPSAEEQRLSELYRHKGIDALVEELKKF
jgi:hypothetical protein